MNKPSELKTGVMLSYVSLFLGTAISIVYTPIMLRMLGQAEYGLYSLATSVIGYLGVLNLGFGSALIRYTAKYKANGDKEGEYSLNGLFFLVYSILALIIIIIGGILVLNVDKLFSSTLDINELSRIKILMSLMILNMAISFPFGIFSGIISAYERFIFPRTIEILKVILNPITILILLFIGYRSVGMVLATTLINIIFIMAKVYYCFKVLKIKIKFKNLEFSIFREIMGYSFFIFLNMIVDRIYWSTDQFILGAVSGTVAVAIYSVGSTFNAYYMSFSTAISGVFLPRVTKMVTKNASDKELSDLFIKTGRVQFIIMSFILSGFILLGREFIAVWAGAEYVDAYSIVLVVMIPLTIPLIQNLGISILQAKNMHKFRSNVYIGIALLNLVATIPMARMFGGIGAALCTGVSMTIGNVIIINIYYYKKINLDIPQFWKEIFKMAVPVLITLVVGSLLVVFIPLSGYFGIIIKAIIFTVLFIVLMWGLGMNNSEKVLFGEPIKKVLFRVIKR